MKKTIFAVAMAFGMVCAAAMAAEPLLLQWGTIDTASAERQAESASLKRSVKAKAAARGAESRAAYMVQFDGVIQGEWRDWLEGVTQVRGYVPENAYLVWATAGEMAKISAHEHVFWTGEWKSEYKTPASVKADVARRAAAKATDEGEWYQLGSFVEGGAEALEARLEGIGAEVRSAFNRLEGCSAVARLTDAQLSAVAEWAETEWIEPRLTPRLFNDMACRTNMMAVTNVWKGMAQGGLGLTGAGQIVAVADTGCDMGSTTDTHADFAGRILAGFGWTNETYKSSAPWMDVDGHGTHVCGSILGDGAKSNGKYRGMAYGAKLVMQGMQENLGGLPDNVGPVLAQAYTNGARIHSDSWGYGVGYAGQYMYVSVYADGFMWTNQNFLMVIAAGNDGADGDSDGVIDPGSVTAPGTSKNCLCVGAAENYRTSGGYAARTYGTAWPNDYPANPIKNDKISGTNVPQGIVAFSGRGPTADGRYKPDIVAPGSDIISVRSRAASDTGWGVNSANTNYLYMGGTSMATPLTAGALALTRQWLVERRGMNEPLAALMKAVLINGARDMTPGQYGTGTYQEVTARPDRSQGFGHVNLYDSLEPGVGRFIDLHTNKLASADAYVTTNVTVGQVGGVYRLTLAWQDFPGTSGATKTLVNDLDLTVTTPGGTVLYPNHFGGADRTNNVETIEFTAAELGTYAVKVQARSVTKTSPHGGQPYALVISGPTTEPPEETAPEFTQSTDIVHAVRNTDVDYDFAELLVAAPYPTPEWSLETSASSADYIFENGLLYYLPTAPETNWFRCTASNSAGSTTCTLTVTVTPGAPDAPTSPWAYNLSSSGFTAAWLATDYATGYRLDVVEGETFEGGNGGALLEEGFESSSPDGWTLSGCGSYSGSPYVGTNLPGSYSLKFSHSGDSALTPVFGRGAEKLTFWTYGNGGSGSTFAVSGRVDNVWTLLDTVTVAQNGATHTIPLTSGTTQLGFFFTKSVNCALDDVVVTASATPSGTWVAGYSNLLVNGTSTAVTGLRGGTKYTFRVRAQNAEGTSDNSPEVTVTTVDADEAPTWSAIGARQVNVEENLLISLSEYVTGSPSPSLSVASTTAATGDWTLSGGLLTFYTTTPGTYTFNLLASNRVGTASTTLTVTASAVAPVFTSGTSVAGTVGDMIEFTATATGVPAPSVTLTSSTADAGEYDAEDGYVLFQPSAAGTYTFTFRASNVGGSATQTITVTVSAAPVTVPTLTLGNATANGFTASWTACTGVSGYLLQVATDDQFTSGGSGAETTLFNNSATSPSSAPNDWTYSNILGSGSYVLVTNATGYIESEEVDTRNMTSLWLTCRARTYGGTSGDHTIMHISYTADSGTTWTELGTFSANSKTMTAKSNDVSLAIGHAAVRFRWTNPDATSGLGVGVDSLVLTGVEASGTGSLVFDDYVYATSCSVTGLVAETRYYARVKGADDWSAVQSIVTAGSVSPTTPYEQWLIDQGLSPQDYPEGGSTGGMPNWESYIEDREPGTGGLEVVPVAGAGTANEVALSFPGSSNRYYELVVYTNLLGAPTTNYLGRGSASMVVTNALDSDNWFGTIRVRLAAPE